MSEALAVALEIAFIGMTLVFMSILLFWLIISLLVKATAERVVEPVVTAVDEAEQERKRQAAATAVAIALALEADIQQPNVLPTPPTPIVSAWQAVMRSSILDKRGSVR
jgi:Na+-transporting methylmalonyl-CoA/oxaloacetate decarboxylase gamma subunit